MNEERITYKNCSYISNDVLIFATCNVLNTQRSTDRQRWSIKYSTEIILQPCLKCRWAVMDGVHTLIFKNGSRPATTSWTNAAWTYAVLWSIDSQDNCCHQMSDFKAAKMHQVQFPQTPLWSLQRSLGPLAIFKGKEGEGKGTERRREGKCRVGEGRERCPQLMGTREEYGSARGGDVRRARRGAWVGDLVCPAIGTSFFL